jgi:tetratricopeptide (TPR) repeat protein
VAELFDRAVAAAREAGDPTLAARALVKQAGHLAAVGKSDAARAALAEAVPHLAGRSAAAPEDLGLRFELAAARIQAANLTMWTESAAAEAVFDAEAAVLRDLAARHPAAQPYRETLARVLTNSANLNASQGKLDPAADRVAEAVELFRTLAADDPRQPAHRAALAAALVTKGMLAEDRNQPDAAAAAHDAAAGELRRLAAESPAVYRHRTALGFALLTAGNLHRRAGRTADALARYDDALAEYRSLVREQSAVPTHHWHLSEAALEAAWLRPAARAALIEEATRHADRAVELAPADRAYQRHRDRVRAATTTPN